MIESTLIVPKEFNKYITNVLEVGAEKYGANSWMKGDNFNLDSNKQSILRHVLRDMGVAESTIPSLIDLIVDLSMHMSNGTETQRIDEESGLYHLSHAGTRCLMELFVRGVK